MTRTRSLARPRFPRILTLVLPVAGLLLMIPRLAFAHVGLHDGSGFAAGLSHPVGGADHVLAMVTVGIWAALSGGRAVWAMPATFLTAMLLGSILGAEGVAMQGIEPMILASIIILGAAAALAWRPPLVLALAGIAVFGAAHGFAHGAEGSAGFGFAAGFLISTAGLHLAGLGLGFGMIRAGQATGARLVGAGAAMAGLALALR